MQREGPVCVDDVGEHRHFCFLETAEEVFGVAVVAVESLFKRRLILSNLSEGERGRRTDEALDLPVAAITGSKERERDEFVFVNYKWSLVEDSVRFGSSIYGGLLWRLHNKSRNCKFK